MADFFVDEARDELEWFKKDWIRIIGVGKTGINALSYFKNVDKDNSFTALAVPDKNFIANSRAEILDFISGTDWLFVIIDIEDIGDLNIAECIKEFKSLPTCPSFSLPYYSMPCEITESGRIINRGELLSREIKLPLVTSIILCPSAEDAHIKNIGSNFGTWIILPKDKIAETGLTNYEIIYQVVDKITCIQSMNCVIGMDFTDVVTTLENQGRACIGFGESLDAENNSLAAVKKVLKSPLFIEDIGKAKKSLLAFVGNTESLSMLEANEAATFLDRELSQSENTWDGVLFQVVSDETANDGVTAFVLATGFEN